MELSQRKIVTRLLRRFAEPRRDLLEARARLAAEIAGVANDGLVAVIESGMDCDGVEYDGKIRIIPACTMAFVKLQRSIGRYADGPFGLSICSIDDADRVLYRSTDHTLRAFEDGHAHALHA